MISQTKPSSDAVLREALREARQYVSDAGIDEDPETVRHSTDLLAKIDTALSSAPSPAAGDALKISKHDIELMNPQYWARLFYKSDFPEQIVPMKIADDDGYLLQGKAVVARLRVALSSPAAGSSAPSPAAKEVRCLGCGSPWTDADLAAAKQKDPRILSCCPERKPLTIDQWMDRALSSPAAGSDGWQPTPAELETLEEILFECFEVAHPDTYKRFKNIVERLRPTAPTPSTASGGE